MIIQLPQRLNLALARRCFVRCRGCYTYFGKSEPDLGAFLESASRFAALGINRITISGGDPLTLRGLNGFLRQLRMAGMQSIKLDTVGTSLLKSDLDPGVDKRSVIELSSLVDVLGLPIDGWSNRTALLFREGRDRLFDETNSILDVLDGRSDRPRVVINTVIHRLNAHGLGNIAAIVASHPCVTDWSIFQYTPTDQSLDGANEELEILDDAFLQACEALRKELSSAHAARGSMPNIEFRSLASRLGDYLLVNSDGRAWLPDEFGRTIALGPIFGREKAVLDAWSTSAGRLASLRKSIPAWAPSQPAGRIESIR